MNSHKLVTPFLILIVCVISCVANIMWLENTKENLKKGELDYYLLSKSQIAKQYSFKEKDKVVPNNELFHPFPQYFAFKSIPITLLRATQRYAKTCHSLDFKKADSIARKLTLSPSKFLSWHKSVCLKDLSHFKLWLERKPLLHPSGITYATLIKSYFPSFNQEKIKELLHVKERTELNDFERFYSQLSLDDQKKYMSNTDKVILENNLILVSKWNGLEQLVFIYPLDKLNIELNKSHSSKIVRKEDSRFCHINLSNFCIDINIKSHSIWKGRWTIIAIAYLCAYIILLLLYLVYQNKKRFDEINEDQALLFQLISHEVRTPLTSLKLNFDSLRGQFEKLSDTGQQSLMQGLDNYSKLEKIIKKALLEIKHDKSDQQFNIYDLTDTIIYNNYLDLVSFTPSSESALVSISPFWYEICLSNLIKNAINHGTSPIDVKITQSQKHVFLEVKDQGTVPIKILKKMLKPENKNPNSSGLGIGLSIINRKIREVGGELIIKDSPTRYIIKLNMTVKKEKKV